MRKSFVNLFGAAALILTVAGCQNQQAKLGRGLTNIMEPLRGGEMNRSVEQASLFTSPDSGQTTGVVNGFCRTVTRTAFGVYEIATFPIPNHANGSYGPIGTPGFKASPEYPDNYKPNWIAGNSGMDTDNNLGVQDKGDVAPMFPGSRFRIFDN